MYSYNFLITIRITYEELCIKFTSILIGIYDLYFLNNNKYQKSFEAKPLFNAIFEEKFMENLVPNFQNLVIKEKNFMIFQLKITCKFSPTIKKTHKEPCIKFSKLFGHSKIFYRHFKKNFSKKSKISVISLTLTFGENFKEAEVKNRSIFTAPNVVNRHKKKKHTSLYIVTSEYVMIVSSSRVYCIERHALKPTTPYPCILLQVNRTFWFNLTTPFDSLYIFRYEPIIKKSSLCKSEKGNRESNSNVTVLITQQLLVRNLIYRL
ncbi:hypothetical protein AGLY_007996 [Aphis glycines]|uniref:Uncharacterized protein n=1 Tax=Aphis glycines TaxID=307491 RepID=A0A6G0TMD1_APHGL|nr:hypothetical protein AGLY_007996 [Aphis glycines]